MKNTSPNLPLIILIMCSIILSGCGSKSAQTEQTEELFQTEELEQCDEEVSTQPMMGCPSYPGQVVCSDSECPCDNTTMPPAKGYLYISEELAEFRLKCLSMSELEEVIRQALPGQNVTGAVGLPTVLCERGARLRKLDLEVAAQDYDTWVKTSKAPCRATPKEK